MSDNKWSDDIWKEKFYATLEKATAPISWIDSYQAKHSIESDRYTAQYITNITVSSKFGQDIDKYLHKTYPEYNHRTEVVIIADTRMRTVEYVYGENLCIPSDNEIGPYGVLPEIKSSYKIGRAHV